MRSGSKRLIGLVALAAVSTLVVAGCAKKTTGTTGGQFSPGYAECTTKIDTCNSGPVKQGGTIIVALGKQWSNWNVNDTDGNLVEAVQVMNLVLPGSFTFLPSGTIQWNKDMLTEEPKVTNANPQTVVYKIKPDAKWDDGTAVSADDYWYAWQTLNGRDKKLTPAGTTGYEDITSVEGSDGGKTVTVTFKSAYPDWKGLFNGLYPAHVAAKSGDIKTDAGLEASYKKFFELPTWSAGPFKFGTATKDQIDMVKNPSWYGATKPALDKITFKLYTDQSPLVQSLQNQEIQAMNIQPDENIYNNLQKMTGQGVQYEITTGSTWEHIDINTKNKWLADPALRTAIFTAVNVQTIIDKTVKSYFPSAKPLRSHNFLSPESSYVDIIKKVAPDQGSGNVDAAKKVLTDAGYTLGADGKLKDKTGAVVPPLGFSYTKGKAARAATAEVVQSQLKQIGIDVAIKTTDDLSTTLSSEDFDMIIFGWAGTPLKSSNADLWKTGGGNNFTQWGDPQSDALLKQVTTELDAKKAADLLNQQDEILTKAAVVLPLYEKPNLMVSTTAYVNIRDNNQGSYFTYNTQEWGMKQT